MQKKAPWPLKVAAIAVLAFLHIPFLIVMLYAFTIEDAAFTFPPPGLTTKWFAIAWSRNDVWEALALSAKVASVSTLLALILGTMAAYAMSQARFFGREAVSFVLLLPIALPGIVASPRSAHASRSRGWKGRSTTSCV
ncbi:MAG: hypothetical protein AAF658_05460, partial [Myxococcota bacterium]